MFRGSFFKLEYANADLLIMNKFKTFLCFSLVFVSYAVFAADYYFPAQDFDTSILGDGKLSKDEMAAILIGENPDLDEGFAGDFAALYIKEAGAEGINHDIAFSQMCYETNFLKFGNGLNRKSNNFGGIGGADESFDSALLGVRAQIQHLKAYATEAPLAQKLADPRYYFVRFGSAPRLQDLSGKWSADLTYGEKVKNLMENALTRSHIIATN